jgi:hypothetical protein
MSVEGAAVSFASAVISAAFAILVLQQWRSHRKAYQMAWTVGLAMFSVAALMQGFAELYGWTVGIYKVYYFVAAPLVAVLGVGSGFLANRKLGLGLALYTGLLSAGFAWVVATATVKVAAFGNSFPAGLGFEESIRIWSPLFTIPGSLVLIGIALYSFWRTRLQFNLWIAAGAIVAAASGSLATLGVTWALYLGEFVGIALMFRGFLANRDASLARTPASEQVPST